MALDFASMLLRPAQVGPLDLGDWSDRGSMEREALKLRRAELEDRIRGRKEERDLRALEEEGRNARANAAAAAEQNKQKQGLYAKFTELNGSGDIEGARAMVPLMTAMGMGVDLEGEEGGLPRYRIEMDAEEAEARESARAAQASPYGPGETAEQSLSRLGAMGYPEETGQLEQPLGIQSTDEVGPEGFTVAERVASTYGEPGEKTPMAAPEEPDYTGGVPKNVIDMGAIASQTAARLNPALGGIIAGLPEAYQGSAMNTASGLGGLGVPATKALDMFSDFQGKSNALINSERAREMDMEKAQLDAARQSYTQRYQADKEGFDRYQSGFNTFGKEIGDQYQIKKRLETQPLQRQAMDILTNPVKEDDMLVLSYIARSFGERGATSDADAARALGLPATSTWDQIADWLGSRLEGGMPESARAALKGVLAKMQKENDAQIGEFSTRMRELIDDPETDRDVARGLRDYWRTVTPKAIRDQVQERTSERGGTSARGAGLQGIETGEVVIPESSRIARVHNNPGNLKFVGQAGATEGEAAGDGGSWAQFDSPEAGLDALRRQIELDASRGLTVREFVSKYAPPESNDTERYISQALNSLRAKEDDLLEDLDTYDVVRFVAKKESGTELPSQYNDDDQTAMAEQGAAERAAREPPMGPPTAAEHAAATKPLSELTSEERKARIAQLKKQLGRQ